MQFTARLAGCGYSPKNAIRNAYSPLARVGASMSSTSHSNVEVVLIYPPWPELDDRAILQNSLPPLGLLSIASYMESLGYRVRVYDVHGEKIDEHELFRRIEADQPRVIGISVLTNMAIPAHKIAKLCNTAAQDSPIVVAAS